MRILVHSFFSIFLIGLWTVSSSAQSVSIPEYNVQVTHAQKLGKTPPIKSRLNIPVTDLEKLKNDKKTRKIVPNFQGRGLPPVAKAGAKPQGPDPVWQRTIKGTKNPVTGTRAPASVIEPLLNITGLTQGGGGAIPPDPSGDIGQDHYVQMVNATRIQAYHKDGATYGSVFSGNSLWTSFGLQGSGDPIVLYSQVADRWILTEFADPFGSQPNTLFIAVSEDSDPLGEYNVYQFGTPQFPDYPKYTLWDDVLCVTTNENGPGLACYFIDLQALLAGEDDPTIQRLTVPGFPGGPGFFVATPVDWSGPEAPPASTGPMFLRMHDDAWEGNQDQIDVYSATIDWNNSNNTQLTLTEVPVADFDSNACSAGGGGFACLPQPNGNGVDGLPAIIMHQSHYRNFGSHESMVMNFMVDATGTNVAGIRWIEMRKSGSSPWSVYQEGTFAPDDGLNRFMGSMAMDGAGNIGMAYAVVGNDEFLGLRFTGRRSSDPLGEMTIEEYVIKEGLGNCPSDRIGDYAHMSLDPVSDRTFWYTGQYQGQNSWGTKIVAFELNRDSLDISPVAAISPEAEGAFGVAESISCLVENVGLEASSDFTVGYVFNNGIPYVENVGATIQPGATYEHVFSPTINLEEPGVYDLMFFTSMEGDENFLNDTLRTSIKSLARYDAGVSGLTGLIEGCGPESQDVLVEITNYGSEVLTTVSVLLTVNGNLESAIWSGSLAAGETATQVLTVSGFIDGTNTLSASTANPNGENDEIQDNDDYQRDFNYINNATQVTLQLRTDNYGSETTWELALENGTIVSSGGPYADGAETDITETICVSPDGCYEFTIYDSYGDGICCGTVFFPSGEGNYELFGPDGSSLAEGAEFTTQESTEFCLENTCLLSGDYAVTPESSDGANDGTIIITPLNGVGPYSYSIDGGNVFQTSNVFDELSGGDYDIVIDGGEDCYFEDSVEVSVCALTYLAETVEATANDSNDGSITLTASGGIAPYQYSIDGGNSFQGSGTFEGLGIGDFDIVIRDAADCSVSSNVEVMVGIESLTSGQLVEIFPNPTDGEFRVNVKGIKDQGPFIDMYIYNMEGRLVQTGYLVKYDDSFTGLTRIFHYPAGAYYVRVISEELDYTMRLLKK